MYSEAATIKRTVNAIYSRKNLSNLAVTKVLKRKVTKEPTRTSDRAGSMQNGANDGDINLTNTISRRQLRYNMLTFGMQLQAALEKGRLGTETERWRTKIF